MKVFSVLKAHTHTHTHIFSVLLLMLMLGFSISSCSKSEKEEIPIELNDLNSTVRSVSCGPEGNNCLSLGTQTSSFLLNIWCF